MSNSRSVICASRVRPTRTITIDLETPSGQYPPLDLTDLYQGIVNLPDNSLVVYKYHPDIFMYLAELVKLVGHRLQFAYRGKLPFLQSLGYGIDSIHFDLGGSIINKEILEFSWYAKKEFSLTGVTPANAIYLISNLHAVSELRIERLFLQIFIDYSCPSYFFNKLGLAIRCFNRPKLELSLLYSTVFYDFPSGLPSPVLEALQANSAILDFQLSWPLAKPQVFVNNGNLWTVGHRSHWPRIRTLLLSTCSSPFRKIPSELRRVLCSMAFPVPLDEVVEKS